MRSVVAIIAGALLIATIVYSCIVMHNFGHGLKEQSMLFPWYGLTAMFTIMIVSQKEEKAGLPSGKHGAYPSMSVRPNRMSIE